MTSGKRYVGFRPQTYLQRPS